MRRVGGEVVLPTDAPTTVAGLVVVEVRDVSLMDVPSVVVADWRKRDVAIGPGARIPFDFDVPERDPGTSLSVRAHVSLDGSGDARRGDPMSVSTVPVASIGDLPRIEVPTSVI